MKAGDKVYCKKDFRTGPHLHFIEGKYYTIDRIEKRKFHHKKGNTYTSVVLTGETIGKLGFVVEKHFEQFFCFPDFFVHLKDMRKQKLNKIKDNGDDTEIHI